MNAISQSLSCIIWKNVSAPVCLSWKNFFSCKSHTKNVQWRQMVSSDSFLVARRPCYTAVRLAGHIMFSGVSLLWIFFLPQKIIGIYDSNCVWPSDVGVAGLFPSVFRATKISDKCGEGAGCCCKLWDGAALLFMEVAVILPAHK